MIKTIVVGYDETEPSKRALDRAAELAQAFGAKLIVTSVAPVLVSVGRGMGAIDPVDPPSEHLAELEHNRLVTEVESPVGRIPTIGPPFLVDGVRPESGPVPGLGEHTGVVLGDTGR